MELNPLTILEILTFFIVLVLIWRIVRYGRPELLITIKYCHHYFGGSALQVILTNEDIEPIQIKRVLLQLQFGKKLDYPEINKPVVIQSKQSYSFIFPLFDYKGEVRGDPLALKWVEIYETRGGVYTYPSFSPKSRQTFDELKKQIKTKWISNNE